MKSFWLKLNRHTFSSDREFLPAALEILESPPSPVRVQLLYIICLLFSVVILWSLIGKVDVVATAPGKILPAGNVKVVQPAVGGKISQIDVKNGDEVKAGDVLVRLDSREIASQLQDAQYSLYAYQAEVLRRKKTDEVARSISPGTHSDFTDVNIDSTGRSVLPEGIMRSNNDMLQRDLGSLYADLKEVSSRIRLSEIGEAAARHSVETQNILIGTISKRAQIREGLMRKRVLSEDAWLEFSASLREAKTRLASAESELSNAQAQQAVYRSEFRKTLNNFISDNMEKCLAAERQVRSLLEKQSQLTVGLQHMALTSPIDGVVTASSVTTAGQMVTQGQELMRIVPLDAKMQVQAYVSNQDIGFMREGQPAEIKVSSFAFNRYGTLKGQLVQVSRDAVSMADSRQLLTDATYTAGSAAVSQGADDLVFPVTIQLDQDVMVIGREAIPLRSGMSVSAEIKTDRRRIISYLLSPLSSVSSDALHER